MQQSLNWNGLVFADPSGGRDGYLLRGHSPQSVQLIAKTIPNTVGRRQRIVGTALSERTSLTIVFQAEKTFSNMGALHAFLKSVQDKMTNVSQTTGTLSYSIMNDDTSYTETGMLLEGFSIGDIGKSGGKYVLPMVIQFSKWGE